MPLFSFYPKASDVGEAPAVIDYVGLSGESYQGAEKDWQIRASGGSR